jgi:hypothetical protein
VPPLYGGVLSVVSMVMESPQWPRCGLLTRAFGAMDAHIRPWVRRVRARFIASLAVRSTGNIPAHLRGTFSGASVATLVCCLTSISCTSQTCATLYLLYLAPYALSSSFCSSSLSLSLSLFLSQCIQGVTSQCKNLFLSARLH